MRISLTISRYIGRQFMLGFAVAVLVVASLMFLLESAELLRRAAREGDAPFALIAEMAALKTPMAIERVLPFAVLFGAMGAFFRLGRSSELISARAAGVSIWQVAAAPLAAAFITGVAIVAIYNPVAAAMHERFLRVEAERFEAGERQFAFTGRSVWLRQADAGGGAAINARSMLEQGAELLDVIVIEFDGAGVFTGRLDARRALLEDKRWRIEDGWRSGIDRDAQQFDVTYLPTTLTLDDIRESFAPPEALSFWQLPRFITALEAAGFSAQRHRLHWHALMALPALLCAMVALAAAFSTRPHRLGGASRSVLGAALVGFAIFFITDLTRAFGLAGAIPAAVAAWTPAIAAAMLATAALTHVEDG